MSDAVPGENYQPSEEEDEARRAQADEQIEANESGEEGQPQYPGDTGVAPDQGEPQARADIQERNPREEEEQQRESQE
jgi:hypothetical protein